MKLLNCKVTHFGSWKELEFDFESLGLGLVYGSTGAGKSTLMDIVPWILYGQTAKGGSVEEVRSWQSGGESTTGLLNLRTGSGEITVCRTRGTTGSNDLYWREDGSDICNRGKDLTDTQKLLETRLGVSSDCFLASAYFHEFSPTASFFTAKAKERRALFENMCNLKFPLRLAERCVQEKKGSKEQLKSQQSALDKLSGQSDSLSQQLKDGRASSGTWQAVRLRAVAGFTSKAKTFEEEKAKKIKDLEEKSQAWEQKALDKVALLASRLQELEAKIKPTKDFDLAEAKARNESRCNACGALPENISQLLEEIVKNKFNNNQYIAELKRCKAELKELGVALNPYEGALQAASTEINTYADKAKEAEESQNPFLAQVLDTEAALMKAEVDKINATASLEKLQSRYDALEHLYDLSFELRGQLINKAISEIQDQTNQYLQDYFDAELRVNLSSKDADNLEIGIQKSGYDCVYTQLSKGQRQLLRLSFSLAVMKSTANNSGTHFSTVFIDEGLDGLDTSLKLKAFRLLQEVSKEHESVLVIDHSQELATLFDKKYHVSLCGDYSQLESETDT